MSHWHAFSYTGSVPSDSDARNPSHAVRPLALADWFRKPASMCKGVYGDPESAYQWLSGELKDRMPEILPHCREHLDLGQDAYAGGYTTGSGIFVRCLLTCPRTGADVRPVPCR